jgi:hypothetical protein
MPAMRSARGDGSRRERSPGVWEIRVTVGPDPAIGSGVQKSFTHHGNKVSARARQRELVTLYGARMAPGPPESACMTVRELLEAFLSSPHPWTPTTWRTHIGEARMLCRDHLGRARLDRMTHSTVERAIARWVHAGAHLGPVPGAALRDQLGSAQQADHLRPTGGHAHAIAPASPAAPCALARFINSW